MRPLRLEIEGFTIYKKPQVIDFEKLSFFVIQGKTGSGKTSIIDAITYALYGKVPRYGDSKATKQVISRGSSYMRVSLDFSVAGKRYRVERFYSERTKEDHARAYEEGRRLNLTKPQIEKWVEEVTGLDYKTFTKVILLPQGEFDRFLKPKQPKDRREILINLLDLNVFERMREIASETFRTKEARLETLKEELRRLKDVSEDSLAKIEEEERRLEEEAVKLQKKIGKLREEIKVLKDLEKVRKALKDLKEEIRRTETEAKEAEEKLRELGERKKKLEEELKKKPELVKELEDTLGALERVRTAIGIAEDVKVSEEKIKGLSEKLRVKEGELRRIQSLTDREREVLRSFEEEIKSLGFDEEEYIKVLKEVELKKNLLVRWRRLREVEEEIKSVEKRIESVKKELEETEAKLSEKEMELKKRETHLHARIVRESLKEGELCPVCGSVFGERELPPLTAEVDELKEEVERLTKRRNLLERDMSKLEGRLSSLRSEEERILGELRGKEEILKKDVEKRFEELSSKRKKVKELERKREELRKRIEELTLKRENLTKEVEKIKAELGSLKKEVEQKRRKLEEMTGGGDPALLKGKLEEKRRSLQERISYLEKKSEELRSEEEELRRRLAELSSKRDTLMSRVSELEREEEMLGSMLRKKVEDVGVLEVELERGEDRLEEVHRKLGELRSSKEQLKEKLRRKRELKGEIEKLEKEVRIYKALAEDLRGDRLQNFVASLMLMRVVERASYYFMSFTGTYEFTLDGKGDLLVIDRVNGGEREVKSLSGGETFLASLSLALGVSDVLSSKANLESLFIDEGFGSLDEETRERVSEILEVVKININRMVGIISHIPDLAERFHQRIVVKRHGDFSTVEVFP